MTYLELLDQEMADGGLIPEADAAYSHPYFDHPEPYLSPLGAYGQRVEMLLRGIQ